MKYRLVALDLDGTLLNNQHRLTDRTTKVIERVKKLGVVVIIATGRMFVSAFPYMKQLGLSGPMITYNGAYVKDITDNKLIYHRPINYDLAQRVIKEASMNNLHINLYLDDRLYVTERNRKTREYEEIAGIEAIEVGSLLNFMKKPPTKILFIEEDAEKLEYFLDYFERKYSPSIEVTKSMKNFIEIMAGGVSKRKALEVVSNKKGINKEEVIAIGDSWNDLAMIKWAGLGIAMADSSVDIKEEADMVAPSNSEEGVAKILARIFNLNLT